MTRTDDRAAAVAVASGVEEVEANAAIWKKGVVAWLLHVGRSKHEQQGGICALLQCNVHIGCPKLDRHSADHTQEVMIVPLQPNASYLMGAGSPSRPPLGSHLNNDGRSSISLC